jgi:nicotinamidase-related amidase
LEAPDWLVVVDLQLVPAFGERVVFTRFVPPRLVEGSWQAYYRRWAFAVREDAETLWDVVDPWRDAPSVASHTFSKWSVVKDVLGGSRRVALCGVSTDCCILGTAFAAVDDGAEVSVVTDACTADPALHAHALAVLERRAPQLALTTVAEELRRNDGSR